MGEQWHVASVSEDNVLMVWQPSRRIWAGEDIEVDERELEEPMEGVESTSTTANATVAATVAAAVTAAGASSAGPVVGAVVVPGGSAEKSRGSTVSRSEGEIEE